MSEPAKKKPVWMSVRQVAEWLDVRHSTVLNWLHIGLRTQDGERVRLRAICVGHRYRTRKRWVKEYIDAVSRHKMPTPEEANERQPESPARQAKRFAAEKQRALDRLEGKR